MNDSVRLSIIVPVYNMMAGGKLEFCMSSLLAQTVDSYEIIAVDDKSTDDSLAFLNRLQEENPGKVRVIASPENRRQGGAKNLGLDAAKGEWIGFIDSDDWITPDMYQKLLKKAEETGAEIVGCDYCLKEVQDFVPEKAEVNNSPEQTGILDETKRKLLFLEPGSMVIKIYQRSIFEENHLRFPEKIFYEDNCLGTFPFLYASRFELVPEAMYFYYQHSTSTVHHISIDKCRDRMKAMSIFLTETKERGFYETYKEEIDYKICELGYKNTLFSYIQIEKHYSFRFLKEMQTYLKTYAPDYASNLYYQQKNDAEIQKLISLHQKNILLFVLYYKALRTYRRLRYGK